MKKRITHAIRDADQAQDGTPDYPELADAVLDAMVEPTDHMIAVATDLGPGSTLRDQWRAMIGAAKHG
jgi:hypothetical protein